MSHFRNFASKKILMSIQCGVAVLPLCAGSQLCAQAVTTAENAHAQPDRGDAEYIVVTARRTEERLNDVPISVAAFGSGALAERRINSEADLQIATPGLTTKQGISSNYLNYAIRGQSVGAFSYSPPAVVSYFNEVPIGGTSATSFFDLASIQVLKGPQGTLFGRNATGGAVLYASTKPDENFGGYLKGAFGNFDDTELEGALNIPITNGIALRFAGRSQTRDGFQHNLIYDTHANSVDSQVGRVSLLIAPEGSGLENVTVFQRGHFAGANGALVLANAYGTAGAPSTYVDPATGLVVPLNISFAATHGPDALGVGMGSSTNPLVNALFNGVGDYLNKYRSGNYGGFYDYYSTAHDGRLDHDAKQTLISNITTFELNDYMTIKNVFGYNRMFSSDFIDIDGSPYEFISISGGPKSTIDGHKYPAGAYVFGTKQWSDELQASGELGSLKYIAGVFVSKEKSYNYAPISISPDLSSPELAYLGAYDAVSTDQSKALFVQLTYAMTDRINVSGGFRNTWEKVGIIFRGNRPGDPALLAGIIPTSVKTSNPSWLVSADYKISDNMMVYFTHRGSWRTGGFNATSAIKFPVADYFQPETTFDFEVGTKFAGRLGLMPVRANIAVYDQYVKNVQRTIYLATANGPAAVAGNVNKARVTGFEIDGSLNPIHWLEVGGAFAYTKARYTDPRSLFGGQTFFFGPYSDTPKIAGSAYFRASADLPGNAGELALRGEFYGQTHWFYSNTDDSASPGTRLPGYQLVNLRAEWNDIMSSEVDASLFVNNLTKEKYYAGGNSNGPSGGFNSVVPGAPRMYGIELLVKF